MNSADEAEHFQAVGLQCREALLALVTAVADPEIVPDGKELPKKGDFVHWSEFIADTVAPGASAARLRGYLKKTANATWDLVNWLTHAQDATPFHGRMAVDTTGNILGSFSSALLYHEEGPPKRCPNCSSYKLVSDYRSDEDKSVTLCATCGWEEPEENGGEPLVVA